MSTFETANFGNHNGSHQLLNSSLPSTASVLDELRFLVDRPAGHIGSEVNWSPYWGCGSVKGWWVLWRGEEDISAPRKNMVKAQVVLVPIEQCATIKNLDELLAAVGYLVPEEETLALLALASAIVDCLARGKSPAIVPSLDIAPLLIRIIWPRLWASARASLSLRTFFGVESLESSYPPDIVVIPTELRPRWGGHVLLDSQYFSSSMVTRWFCGDAASTQLNSLVTANVSKLPCDISVLERLGRIAGCLERLHSSAGTITDALLIVRSVESFKEGLVLPEEDIQIVASMLENLLCATVGEVRTSSLAKLDIFEDLTVFEEALSRWVEDRLPAQSVEDALWIIEHQAGVQHSDWWRSSVGTGIANGCKSMSQTWGQALWSWWDTHSDSLQHTIEHIPVNARSEKWISDYTPVKVNDELLTAIVNVCRERKWASLLARSLGSTRPLKHCIEVLRHTVPNPEAGLDILLSERSAGDIVDVAAAISWNPLYDKAVLLTVASPQLLARVSDFKRLIPLLLHHLSASGDFPADLLTALFLGKVFDAIVKGDESCIKIAKHLGHGAGQYLIGHQEEENLWLALLPVVSTEFVTGAVDEWWKQFLNNETAIKPVRSLYENVIKSAPSKVRGSSITFVMKLLRLLPEIPETQFQDWMDDEGFSGTIGDHSRLADLLLERKWSTAVKKFRWSWKRELKLVAWHARKFLSWSDKFWQPPEGADQTIHDIGCDTKIVNKLVKEKMKILFLAANPMSTNRLALDEEARSIEEKVRNSRHRDSVSFRSRWAVQPSDLQQAILEDEPTVVHFSGHGGGSIGIAMHSDTQGSESLVSSDALADLFRVLKDGIRLVVLNACYSEVQATAIVKQIDFVVGMNDSIGDEAAKVFAGAFYRGLSFGKSVQSSFDLGINELILMGLKNDQMIPQLLVRTGVDATTTTLIKNSKS